MLCMDPERTVDLNPKLKAETKSTPKPAPAAPKTDPAPRIEPTLKPEPGAFKPETAAEALPGAYRGFRLRHPADNLQDRRTFRS